jgi:hypothetical protein
MPAAYTTLTLSNGFTSANLVDGTNYALLSGSWAPAVASRRVSRMGGLPLYEDVIEEISLTVMGSTAAAALDNLATLSVLLDRAEAWAAGDFSTPTLLTCQPQGSALVDPLRSVVLGRPQGEGPLLSLPPTFNDKLMVFEIAPVTISFLRRGQWLGITEVATAAAAANPARLLATFASATELPAPATVSLDGFEDGGDLTGPGFLLVCPDESLSRFVLVNAAVAIDTGTLNWSTVNEGAKYAYGTSVARFGPAGTIYTTPLVDVTITGVAQVAVFAAVRNNTPGATWQIAMQHYSLNGGASTPLVTVDDSSLDPQVVYLGLLSHPLHEHRFQLVLQGDDVNATIDINYFVFLPMSPETTVIALQRNVTTIAFGGEDYSLAVDPRAITDPTPVVLINKDPGGTAPTQQPISYRGDAYTHQIGTYLAAMLLLTNGVDWRLNRTSVATEHALTVTRRRAYLTPL